MIEQNIQTLIKQFRGEQELNKYLQYRLNDLNIIAKTCKDCLANVPPKFGRCAQLSAFLAGFLQDEYNIPAIVVAGDLKIRDKMIFKSNDNLPSFEEKSNEVKSTIWDGHCWVEIDDYILDISIFRTAYSIKSNSVLKDYIESSFGLGRGAMVSPKEDMPSEMKYIPKYILTDVQIDGLVASLFYELQNNI